MTLAPGRRDRGLLRAVDGASDGCPVVDAGVAPGRVAGVLKTATAAVA
ncbi:hypothetical protein ACQP00_27900 [Dactylosporangium sp. CS-047395]